jgi:predicted signal transduction protein with EAL and GGDEF domain
MTFRNLFLQKQLINNLRRLAMFDTQTDLPNRRFSNKLSVQSSPKLLATVCFWCAFVRIDNFDKLTRDYNDSGDPNYTSCGWHVWAMQYAHSMFCAEARRIFVILVSNV